MVIAKLINIFVAIIKKVLKVAAVIILCLVFLALIPNLPPYVEYNAYNVTPPVPLKGALSVNTLLNNAERLYEGELKGPEAFDVHNGVLYTGLHGGEIVKFVNGKITAVTKFGQPCQGFWEEKKCGRPLGIKFGSDGLLYVADAYYGVFKVNVDNGSKTKLISVNDSINGKIVKLPNSIDVAEDGTLYWTISSSDFHLEDGVFDMLADGSGRLLKYDPKKKKNEVLIDNLHFANGVVLSSNEEFVLVAETARSRIHRYYLKGPKKGIHDIFLDGLPGLPDNLKSDGSNGFFIPLVLARDSSNPVIFQSLGQFPSIRKAFSRFLALLELLFWQIDVVFPNYYAKRAIHFIGHFESVHGIGSKRFSVLHVNEDGEIKSSYHSTDGKLTGISEIHWFNGAFYLGSPYNNYLARVVLEFPEVDSNNNLPLKEDLKQKKQVYGQKQSEEQQQKQPLQEKPVQPIQQQKQDLKQQKHLAEDERQAVQGENQSIKDDISARQQQKQSIETENKPVKQLNKVTKEQNVPAQQKQPKESYKVEVQQQTEQSKEQKPQMQQQTQSIKKEPTNQDQKLEQKNGKQEKPAVQQKKPVLQQKRKSVKEENPAVQQQPLEAKLQTEQQLPVDISKASKQQQKQQQPAQQPRKPAVQHLKQQQVADEQQQKLLVKGKKIETQQQKQPPKEQKMATEHYKPPAKEIKPQVQQQKKSVKEQTSPVQQKEQSEKHKPPAQQQKPQIQEQVQQQKQAAKEQKPLVQKEKKTVDAHKPIVQQSGSQQQPIKMQKASSQQPVLQAQRQKPSMQQEKLSIQQEQLSEVKGPQKLEVQDNKAKEKQQPPK